MSKLAIIRQYSYAPAAGGIFSFLKPIVKFVGKGLGLIKTQAPKIVQVTTELAKSPAGKAILAAGAGTVAGALMAGGGGAGGGAGASGGFTYRRRSRGITARELRGYRKVARLLHKEGMVSRIARGRHH